MRRWRARRRHPGRDHNAGDTPDGGRDRNTPGDDSTAGIGSDDRSAAGDHDALARPDSDAYRRGDP